MKKIILIIFVFVFMYLLNYNEYNISDDSIRFRVIANSNSIEDIVMKEKVVNELSGVLFKKVDSKKEAQANIYNNLENIENRISKLFIENNYNESFNISYGLNKIPRKIYRGEYYKEGLYDSLVIEIGAGKGNNYFCVLYPSLCILDYEKETENEKYKFKIIEKIKEIF